MTANIGGGLSVVREFLFFIVVVMYTACAEQAKGCIHAMRHGWRSRNLFLNLILICVCCLQKIFNHVCCLRIIFMTAFVLKDKFNVCVGFSIDSTICFEIAS